MDAVKKSIERNARKMMARKKVKEVKPIPGGWVWGGLRHTIAPSRSRGAMTTRLTTERSGLSCDCEGQGSRARRALANPPLSKPKIMITYEDFAKVDIRIGKIVEVEDFPEARKPAYKLQIDFGSEVGVQTSSAQITERYQKEDLIGKQIIAVVNFAPKPIGPFVSDVLTLGLPDEEGEVVLPMPAQDVPLGGKLF